MATALVKGLLIRDVFPKAEYVVCDPNESQLEALRINLKDCNLPPVRLETSNQKVALEGPKVIMLCVKPQIMPLVLAGLREVVRPETLIISIAAGISVQTLEDTFNRHSVVRVMPNTPALVGSMAAGYYLGSKATKEDGEFTKIILSSLGVCHQVYKESLIDAITGLSGSGPAFVFVMIEAMADGGVRAGLPRKVALDLAAQTVYGAAKMVLETGRHPGELKDSVASPAGTTIEGLAALEEGGVRAAYANAVYRAAKRAEELSRL